MTAARLQPAAQEVGGWYLYRWWPKASVKCAISGCQLRHPLYIGKTNDAWRRHDEHSDKAWRHLAAGYTIDEQVYATEAECLAAEEAAIHAELPLANDIHNRGNPHRLVFDAPPPKVPVARRRPGGGTSAVRATPKPVKWSRRRRYWTWIPAVWAVVAVVAAVLLCLYAKVPVEPSAFQGAAVATAVVSGWGTTRAKRKKTRESLRVWWVVALGLYGLWMLGVLGVVFATVVHVVQAFAAALQSGQS